LNEFLARHSFHSPARAGHVFTVEAAHDVDHESYLQRRSRKIKGCNGRCSHPLGDLSWRNAKSGCSGMVCLFCTMEC
jgi:hypothetical protein